MSLCLLIKWSLFFGTSSENLELSGKLQYQMTLVAMAPTKISVLGVRRIFLSTSETSPQHWLWIAAFLNFWTMVSLSWLMFSASSCIKYTNGNYGDSFLWPFLESVISSRRLMEHVYRYYILFDVTMDKLLI